MDHDSIHSAKEKFENHLTLTFNIQLVSKAWLFICVILPNCLNCHVFAFNHWFINSSINN